MTERDLPERKEGGQVSGTKSEPEVVTFNNIPPICDSTTVEPALDYLEKLKTNPDRNSQ